jgi:hypothetical protein
VNLRNRGVELGEVGNLGAEGFEFGSPQRALAVAARPMLRGSEGTCREIQRLDGGERAKRK